MVKFVVHVSYLIKIGTIEPLKNTYKSGLYDYKA